MGDVIGSVFLGIAIASAVAAVGFYLLLSVTDRRS